MASHRCPHWLGYLLLCPLRRLGQKPEKILAPFVAEGMTALDVGPGMGYFSLPMARMVGPAGSVLCVDVEEKMLRSLEKRAARAALANRIVTRTCGTDSLGLDDFEGRVDFALAFAMVHEVPDAAGFFAEVASALKPGGRVLLAEPKGHVKEPAFAATLDLAAAHGLAVVSRPAIASSHAAVLARS
jgi:2-polyprenyl-3-methyl-5-hydroxy-6-metoxy-1,4-benzoquinol methylase